MGNLPRSAPNARPMSPSLELCTAEMAENTSGAPLPKASKVTPWRWGQGQTLCKANNNNNSKTARENLFTFYGGDVAIENHEIRSVQYALDSIYLPMGFSTKLYFDFMKNYTSSHNNAARPALYRQVN